MKFFAVAAILSVVAAQ
ncbi:hypothetical protein AYI68_g2374, partial [Smittium mucronatum]